MQRNLVLKIDNIWRNDASKNFFSIILYCLEIAFLGTQTQNSKNYNVPKDNSRLILEF